MQLTTNLKYENIKEIYILHRIAFSKGFCADCTIRNKYFRCIERN